MEIPRTQSIENPLRDRRVRRHLSQFDLAVDAEISARHLGLVATGKAQPNREMVLHLAEQLEVLLREAQCFTDFGGLCGGFFGKIARRRIIDGGEESR